MAKQKQFFIVKLMPRGEDIKGDGCQYLRGDTNRAYTEKEAEQRAAEVANVTRREVGVFALTCVFRPPLNIERVEVEKEKPSRRRKT